MNAKQPSLAGPAQKPVGIWIRVSTEDQVRGESPEVHEKRARMYAEARDWRVREVYRLEAVSGKAVMEHPEAKRMLADIRSGHITGLVFSKIARLARNTRELLDFADAFRDANADMISLYEAIDTGSPAGRLFFTIVAAMAQWEREEIAERVAASVPIRAKLGKPVGGAAPFGYHWRDKKLEPDPKEAPIRALMYELFAEHRRKKAVARLLNERGYRTRKGSKFSDTTVWRLLRDTTAKGVFRQNYTRTSDRTKSWELKPESEWVLTPVQPIVSVELWEECNRFLDDRRAARKKPSRLNVHLFTGFTYCECGTKMYVGTKATKYICPKCRTKIPASDLEAIYRDRLSEFLLSPEDIAAHIDAANETIREKETLIVAAQAELKKLEAEAERLYQLYLSDQLSKEDFGRRHKPLSERRTQLEDELPRVQAQLDVLRIAMAGKNAAIAEASDLSIRWGQFSRPEKRQLVETITDKIVVGKDEVAINLLYFPASLNTDGKATNPCRRVAFPLPGVPVTLTRDRPKLYPEKPKTLGEHLRKKRGEQGLTQAEAASQIGVNAWTYLLWENGRTRPSACHYPAIVRFLGYDPSPVATTLAERVAARRRELGLTIELAAKLAAVDAGTFARLERGQANSVKSTAAANRFLALMPE